jgi:hypothetical protein
MDFRKLDKALENISKIGAFPLLCVSYLPEGISPPKQYSPLWRKIARLLAEHTIRRGVRYFEVWNEPSNKALVYIPFKESYLPLYESVVKGIMDAAKRLKVEVFIGGCAQGNDVLGYEGLYPFNKEKVLSLKNVGASHFLGALVYKLHHLCSFCKEKKLPLHFYSYHLYGKSAAEHEKVASIAKKILSLYGFNDTRLFITEWNLGAGGFEGDPLLSTPFASSYTMEVISTLMEVGVDAAFIFSLSGWSTSPKWWAMIGRDGKTKPSFHAFCALSRLKGSLLRVEGEGVLAARDGGEIFIILWNHSDKKMRKRVFLEDVKSVRLYKERVGNGEGEWIKSRVFSVDCVPFSVYLIKGEVE